MRRRSNQRITKIKRDFIEELLKKAEAIDVKDGTSIQPPGSDLVPYPDMNNLRLWTRDYLLKGLNKIFITNLDKDGQTYLTTLLDGLPLHTKMTKTIASDNNTNISTEPHIAEFITVVGNPTIGNTGLVTNFSGNDYLTILPEYIKAGTELKLVFTTANDITTNQNIISSTPLSSGPMIRILNSELAEWTDSKNVITNPVSANTKYFLKYTFNSNSTATAAISTDDTNYNSVTINDMFNLPPTAFNIGNRAADSDKRPFLGTIDLSNSSITVDGEVKQFWISEKPGEVKTETSKPGLWLSNLLQPVSNTIAGSWLRSNLIHSNENSFNYVNSDTIGNYSYSFLQRALIFDEEPIDIDKFCPTGDDIPSTGISLPSWWNGLGYSGVITYHSYNQHWSPSALSCMSYRALPAKGAMFNNTYTTYQTLVTPSNPDMQTYDEAKSKCVDYDFTRNNNNIPLQLQHYTSRLVGTDWTYELRFSPNGNGSENNYGQGEGCTGENCSNGGCVTGYIVYEDSKLGTTCRQEVNSCFQTNQSYFNPEVPDVPTNEPIDDGSKSYSWSGNIIACCDVEGYGEQPVIPRGSAVSGSASCGKILILQDDGTVAEGSTTHSGYISYDFSGSATCGRVGWRGLSSTCDTTGYCGGGRGRYTIRVTEGGIEPQEGIDLWLNIIDLKGQYEAEGLPWSGGCGTDRFTFYISTEKCKESYCTSELIASNVDINALGDISKLEEKVWSNM